MAAAQTLTPFVAALVAILSAMGVCADEPDPHCEVHGRVFDEDGKPIANVDIAPFWGANGLRSDEILELQKQKHWKRLSRDEGQMAPWSPH